MEPTHAILTSSAVYLIIVIFIKARSCSTAAKLGSSSWKQEEGEASGGEATTHHLRHFLASLVYVDACTTERDATMHVFLISQCFKEIYSF